MTLGIAVAYREAAATSSQKKSAKQKTLFKKPDPYKYELRFLNNCHGSVKMCYGCHGKFRNDKEYPGAPGDLVVVTQMLRSFKQNNEEQNGKVQPVYFHANTKCISKLDGDFVASSLIVKDEMKDQFVTAHKTFLKQFTGRKF